MGIHQVPYAAHKREPDCCPITAIARSLPRVEGDSGRGGRCGVGLIRRWRDSLTRQLVRP